jgi:hypothetical protein
MSTLWTPEGEWPVNEDAGSQGSSLPGRDSGQGGQSVGGHKGHSGQSAGGQGVGGQPSTEQSPSFPPEANAASSEEEEIARLRKELADAPVEVVLANHAAGIFELATIYMFSNPPKLPQAQLAIDALGALLGGLKGRLGEAEKTMEDALAQIRVAYVQMVSAQEEQGSQNSQGAEQEQGSEGSEQGAQGEGQGGSEQEQGSEG